MIILRVAVPCPLPGLFDYLGKPEEAECYAPGCRVTVPFGRRTLTAVILEIADHSQHPSDRLRRIDSLLDATPVLPDEVLRLLEWSARYYHHPIGDVVATALPARLRKKEASKPDAVDSWRAVPQADINQLASQATMQRALLQSLIDAPAGLTADELSAHGNWRSAIRELIKKGLVTARPLPCWGLPEPHASAPGPQLNTAQQEAADRIIAKLGQDVRFLLYGITGSGKTEVFIQAMLENRAAGKQALLLVPEIGLTPQLIQRLRHRLGGPMALLHSGLNERERHCHWEMARLGEADIIIGTRSAIFTPIPRLGLVIVDEEHDGSLKQQDGFRYHARDLAIMRAGQLGIPVVMASATPSTESLAHTEKGNYELLELTERAGAARPPEMSLVDLRRDPGDDGISGTLIKRAQQHLERGGQVMFFINRRGFAPTLLCDACGWVAQCSRCDARMTLHERENRLRCHHCGHEERPPQTCNNCGSSDLVPLGQGTERIEQVIARHFPEVSTTRIDRDSTRRKGTLEEELEKARSGEAKILIGTQMLAKGHDFPGLTLVGVLDSDQGLFSADFRAAERMAQLILQVSGRAGRSDQPGEVIIQTRHPDHPLLQSLIHQDYPHFAQGLLAERKIARLPPYSFLALLRVEATDKQAPPAFIDKLLSALPRVDNCQCMGPTPAPMEKRAGRFRYQMLIQSDIRKALHRQLDILLRQIDDMPEARTVRWSLDVDPVELF